LDFLVVSQLKYWRVGASKVADQKRRAVSPLQQGYHGSPDTAHLEAPANTAL